MCRQLMLCGVRVRAGELGAKPAPFSRIKIRTGELVFCGDDVALIRRDRADSTHYTPPGGNVEVGEDLGAALGRELAEERGPDIRATLAEQELDELPDGSHEVGVIEWIDYRKTAELPNFPPIGPVLAALTDPHAAVTNAALDAVTDANYAWV